MFLAPALAVLLAAAVGISPTKARVGPEGMLAMGLACGLSLLATVLGSVPVAWAALRSRKQVKNLGYGASLFRLVILTVLAALAALLVDLHLRTFLLWLGKHCVSPRVDYTLRSRCVKHVDSAILNVSL